MPTVQNAYIGRDSRVASVQTLPDPYSVNNQLSLQHNTP